MSEQQGFTFMCQRSGRGRGCVAVNTRLTDCEVITPHKKRPTEQPAQLGKCCLCDSPASVTGPRGSCYCALHGCCGRCGTSVTEMVQDKQGVYLCPCYWDWDPATKQRRVQQPTLMNAHYQHGGKV